jgi:ABC-type dipeptide/oligopeptide/nickel transport system ATPase component
MPDALLRVEDLRTTFTTYDGTVRAVDGVSFEVHEGETFGLVGESGSGKSVTALSLMRLIPDPPGRIVGGQAWFRGQDLLALDEAAMRRIRGNDVAMIFQEPMTSLNPVFRIGDQIAEAVLLHQGLGVRLSPLDKALARGFLPTKRVRTKRRRAMERVVDLLGRTGIADPERVAQMYPHELSGGMRQRAMIAMALSCHPALLIADEPTTALDVTIQAQILDLMRKMQREEGSAVLLITHHLGVVAEFCQRVAVMHGGRIVEQATTEALFAEPLHPYTQELLAVVPDPSRPARGRLPVAEGRWRHAVGKAPCREPLHHLVEASPGHLVACTLRHKDDPPKPPAPEQALEVRA